MPLAIETPSDRAPATRVQHRPRRVQVRFNLATGGIASRVYRVVDEPGRFVNHDEPHVSPAEMGAMINTLAEAGRLLSASIIDIDRAQVAA